MLITNNFDTVPHYIHQKITPQFYHVCKDSQICLHEKTTIKEIRKWQHNTKRQISRLLKKGFMIISYDEAIFVYDPAHGKKYWLKVGYFIVTTYKTSHNKTPELNGMERYWASSKKHISVFAYYESFTLIYHILSEYLRMAKHNIDIFVFLFTR